MTGVDKMRGRRLEGHSSGVIIWLGATNFRSLELSYF